MQITHPLQSVKSVAYEVIDWGLKPSIHHWFNVNDQRFVYCYIRKNACSTFKNFILETSHKTFDPDHDANLEFLREHHGIPSPDDIRPDDISFFVYRDPWDRLVSLYLNKFVAGPDRTDIGASYQKWTGQDSNSASFSDFVQGFCAAPFKIKDPHIKPQAKHLFDMDYTHAVPIGELHGFAEKHFGHAVAKKYFQTPVNATSGTTTTLIDDATNRSAGDLKNTFRQTKVLPRKSDFANAHLIDLVKTRYAVDYTLVQRHDANT